MYCMGFKMYSDVTWPKLYLSCKIARADFPVCAFGAPGDCAAVANGFTSAFSGSADSELMRFWAGAGSLSVSGSAGVMLLNGS